MSLFTRLASLQLRFRAWRHAAESLDKIFQLLSGGQIGGDVQALRQRWQWWHWFRWGRDSGKDLLTSFDHPGSCGDVSWCLVMSCHVVFPLEVQELLNDFGLKLRTFGWFWELAAECLCDWCDCAWKDESRTPRSLGPIWRSPATSSRGACTLPLNGLNQARTDWGSCMWPVFLTLSPAEQ